MKFGVNLLLLGVYYYLVRSVVRASLVLVDHRSLIITKRYHLQSDISNGDKKLFLKTG